MNPTVTCIVLFAHAPVLGLCVFVSVTIRTCTVCQAAVWQDLQALRRAREALQERHAREAAVASLAMLSHSGGGATGGGTPFSAPPLGTEAFTFPSLGTAAFTAPPLDPSFTAPPLGTAAIIAPPLSTRTCTGPSLGIEGFTFPPLGTAVFTAPPLGTAAFTGAPHGTRAFSGPPLGTDAFTFPPLGTAVFTAHPLGTAAFTTAPHGILRALPGNVGRLSGAGALWDGVPPVYGAGSGSASSGAPLGAVPALPWSGGEVSLGSQHLNVGVPQPSAPPPLGFAALTPATLGMLRTSAQGVVVSGGAPAAVGVEAFTAPPFGITSRLWLGLGFPAGFTLNPRTQGVVVNGAVGEALTAPPFGITSNGTQGGVASGAVREAFTAPPLGITSNGTQGGVARGSAAAEAGGGSPSAVEHALRAAEGEVTRG